MSQETRLEVFDKNGWRKIYPLPTQPIVHLGSDPGNEVVLTGDYDGQVAPIHAQLIASGSTAGYQLVNLADTPIILDPAAQQTLPPRSAMTLVDGQQFLLGDFRLVFYGAGSFYSGPVSDSSPHIGLTLLLAQTELKPGQAISGVVTVQNLSAAAGVQFEVDLFGLDDDCFDLEPGPLLSSGAAKDVSLHLYHRGPKPAAGECRLTLRATAPRTYPGEQVEVSQSIRVLPYYHHRLELLPPSQPAEISPMDEELLPKGKAGPLPRREQPAMLTQPGGAVVAAAGLAGAAALSQAGSQSPQPPVETATADWWGTPAETSTSASETPAAAPTEEPAADWWAAPAESQPSSQPEPEPKADETPVDWWVTPAAAEPTSESAAPEAVEPKIEESLPAEVGESPVAKIAPELSPKLETPPIETPAVVEPPPETEPSLNQPVEAAAPPVEEPAGINKWWAGLRTALPFKGRQEDVAKAQPIGATQESGAVSPPTAAEPPAEIIPTAVEPISVTQEAGEAPATEGADVPVEPEPEAIVEAIAAAPPEIEAEPEIVEPPPALKTAIEETPVDTVTTLDEVAVGDTQTIETGLETGLEETAEPEDWWGGDTPTRQETPPPANETPEAEPPVVPPPATEAPDWWSAGPPAAEAGQPVEQTEATIKTDDETDTPVTKTTPETSAASTDPATGEDIPDWWHAEPADTDDENNS